MRRESAELKKKSSSLKSAWLIRILIITIPIISVLLWFYFKPGPGSEKAPGTEQATEITHEQTDATIAPHRHDLFGETEKPSTTPLPTERHIDVSVNPNDTVLTIFQQLGLETKVLYQIMNLNKKTKEAFSRLRAGQHLSLVVTTDAAEVPNQLVKLEMPLGKTETLVINQTDEGYHSEIVVKAIETTVKTMQAKITGSLYGSGLEADIPLNVMHQFADIFNARINFSKDIQPNDRFIIKYQEKFANDELVQAGPIIAAEFIGKKRTWQAIRYRNAQGIYKYYAPNGESLKASFSRAPLKHFRISSPFSLARKHPVLGFVRAHKGTDFAAPTGTPIHVTGDGVISFLGWEKGFGRTVIVQHGGNYSTLYAHMSKFASNQKVGTKVSHGDIIGYVGSSGLATGPHVHYEFHVNGVARDSQKINLPGTIPLTGANLQKFKKYAAKELGELNKIASL